MSRLEESKISGSGEGKVMYIPPMEPLGARFFASVFRSIGYDARALKENNSTLAMGLKHTGGGECVPCPSTTGALLYAMQQDNVEPDRVVFFMPTACGPCRFGQYAKLDNVIFEKMDWDGVKIMSPSAENAYEGIDNNARMLLYHALISCDIMRKLAHKVRPYEQNKGETDSCIEDYSVKLEGAFESGKSSEVERVMSQAVDAVSKIKVYNHSRPLVGIVGEVYVRCDPFINNDVYRKIEDLGGECWLAPISEWILYTNYLRHLIVKEQQRGAKAILERIRIWLETNLFFERVEKRYYKIAEPILHDRHEHSIIDVMEEGMKYLPWQFEGEAVLTLGRAALFVKRDHAQAIVNTSPMFCMPGTITTSIFPALEKELGVPIICNFYDGSGDPNQSLVPVMHYITEKHQQIVGA